MAEASKTETILVEEGFPAPTIPTIFCDGILNLAPIAQAMRFYLFRSDPDQVGKPKFKKSATCPDHNAHPSIYSYCSIF